MIVCPSGKSYAKAALHTLTSFFGEYDSWKGCTVHFKPSMYSSTWACFPAQEMSACESDPNLEVEYISSSFSKDMIFRSEYENVVNKAATDVTR